VLYIKHANLLLHELDCSVLIFIQVLARHETNHVCVLVCTRNTHRGALRVQDEWPPIGGVSVLEERHTVCCAGNRLVASVLVDVGVVLNLQRTARVQRYIDTVRMRL
jgi:hypothetical protein